MKHDASIAAAPTVADVRQAAQRIRGEVVQTPLSLSRTLSSITGCNVWIKFENLQYTASFKERGALNRIATLPEGTHGVVAMSAGNHAQGVAYHATRRGLEATIVMPVTTPSNKVARTELLGAVVELHGSTLEDAATRALAIAADNGHAHVHPFDDPRVIAGQGTVALEMLAERADLDVLIVPVGGGGLIAGMAVAAGPISPGVEIVGVQSMAYPWAVRSLEGRAGSAAGSSIAEGIAVKQPGVLTSAIIEEHVDDVVAVSEAGIEAAVALYLEIEKVVAEGAGAAGLAALLEYPDRWRGRNVGLVLTGGNIDLRLLAQVIQRELARSGRRTHLRVHVPDAPESLAGLTRALARCGATVLELRHERFHLDVAAKEAVLGLVVETRDHRHAAAVTAALAHEGFVLEAARSD